MNNKSAINVLFVVTICLIPSLLTRVQGEEPTSDIDPTSDQYALCNDPDVLTFTTTVTPTPLCPDDVSDGDPTYYWDYGTLDGDDSTPGTLTIDPDEEGDYSISVYCVQQFEDSQGNDYTVQTLPSQ